MTGFVAHIGLPKTGTTTLQSHVFSKNSEIFFLGKNSTGSKEQLSHIMRIAEKSNLDEIQNYGKDIRLRVNEQNVDYLPVLISSENYTFPRKMDWKTAPERLKRLLNPTRVVLVIRNQFRWLESYYFYHQAKVARSGKLMLPDAFVRRELANGERGAFPVTNFGDLIRVWERSFGRHNVDVLPYELMSRNPIEFFRPFGAALETDTEDFCALLQSAPRLNDRITIDRFYTGLHHTYLRKKNVLLFKLAQLAGFSLENSGTFDPRPSTYDFRAIVPEPVRANWRVQNAAIAQDRALDLAGLGYEV